MITYISILKELHSDTVTTNKCTGYVLTMNGYYKLAQKHHWKAVAIFENDFSDSHLKTSMDTNFVTRKVASLVYVSLLNGGFINESNFIDICT